MTTAGHHVQLVRDATFAHLDADGGINATPGTLPDGLFLRDARHLSRWQLTVDGNAPGILVPAEVQDDATAACVLTLPARGTNPPRTPSSVNRASPQACSPNTCGWSATVPKR